MNRSAVFFLLSLSPLMATAATPWLKWETTYVRLEDDGNLACVRDGNSRNCNWAATTPPAATARSLACGAQVKKEWGITGYDSQNHWCNRAYADNYASWKRGDFVGFNGYLAQNPAGDLLCDSGNGLDCRPGSLLTAPPKPINPLPCGPVAKAEWGDETLAPEHWCQQARVLVDERDYADPMWATATFAYEQGWAGKGFGLGGSQRGAPEAMRIVARDGRKGLGIRSLTRDAAWFQRYPGGLYSVPDSELQDDLYLYGARAWKADDEPVVVMHIYRPKGTVVSLRLPAISNYQGVERTSWPGIWLRANGIRLRTVLGDYMVADAALENAAGRWWTLGLKVTRTGDIEYYAVADWRDTPFEPQLLRGKQSALLGSAAYNVLRQADATVLISTVLADEAEAVIGDIRYGLNTQAQKRQP